MNWPQKSLLKATSIFVSQYHWEIIPAMYISYCSRICQKLIVIDGNTTARSLIMQTLVLALKVHIAGKSILF